ncbi:AmmeMemoRadiSam system radical SAM enzyme [Candidatus Woesearchaeota archaeon CG10_big_fil_rev_8_21_14_0_10_45_5]|nr:MAG: AmmeMemoRadiSam system radical SAM enzyme [Candidatus Woesearchaeota archaeon CG10_big_fil_rev_8_21_14_0_10_45_5]PIU29806.1 MAG: AmmeMemoRadiSam system radical SAM enzyme [Candidatus Woesearchaeota archaeon CG07_land_8_20_14_0_80_44_23]
MKEALFYKKIFGKKVSCELCPRHCIILDGKFGFCRARKNIGGKLFSMVYGKPASVHVDPIEKKPLFHFLPGSSSLSLGTTGCNFACDNCQNYEISQAEFSDYNEEEIPAEKIVALAKENMCKSISFTYNEPTIFFEYMLDIAKLARKEKIKNVIVSNGYIEKKPLSALSKYIDAANIDLKGDAGFYKRVCKAEEAPVLETLKALKKAGVWLELTNLLITGMNDSEKDIEKLCIWIEKNLGRSVPLHFSRFFPVYKMLDVKVTPESSLERAYSIAKRHLDFVYTGNIMNGHEDTSCMKCGRAVVRRSGFFVEENQIEKGKCRFCKTKIPGVWE